MTTPAVVMRPISPDASSVNHSAPSGPVVIPLGLPPPGTGNSSIAAADAGSANGSEQADQEDEQTVRG